MSRLITDPRVIYLSVACNPDHDFGRMWSTNGDGPECCCEADPPCEPTRYVLDRPALTDPKERA